MTYKCKHCGQALVQMFGGVFEHEERHDFAHAAEPDGLMPEPLSREQELCSRWQEKRDRLYALLRGSTGPVQASRYEAGLDEIDLFLADLRKTFHLPAEPTKS